MLVRSDDDIAQIAVPQILEKTRQSICHQETWQLETVTMVTNRRLD